MCGRYSSSRAPEDLVAEFDAVDLTDDVVLPPDYNVAPTKQVYVVRRSHRVEESEADTDRALCVCKWGLVPSWSKDASTGARMLNARAESLASKPAFRAAFAKRRCLVPADGWYEWAKQENAPGKQPYFMTPGDGGVLAFAGLWEVWGTGDERLYTCTVVTTDAVGELQAIHDRMPLVLPPDRWESWLGETPAEADALLLPTPESFVRSLEIRPVSSAVGNVKNNSAELVRRVEVETTQTLF